jgi:hypothetical protein
VTSTTEVADTTTEPVAIINGDPVTSVWPVPEIVIVPIPNTSGSAPDVWVIEFAVISTGPMLKTRLFPIADILTLLTSVIVENGNLANESHPKSIIIYIIKDNIEKSFLCKLYQSLNKYKRVKYYMFIPAGSPNMALLSNIFCSANFPFT